MGSCNGVPNKPVHSSSRKSAPARQMRDAGVQCTYTKPTNSSNSSQKGLDDNPATNLSQAGLGAAQLAKMIQLAHRQNKRNRNPLKEVLIANQLLWVKKEGELELSGILAKQAGQSPKHNLVEKAGKQDDILELIPEISKDVTGHSQVDTKLKIRIGCQSTQLFTRTLDDDRSSKKLNTYKVSTSPVGKSSEVREKLRDLIKPRQERRSLERLPHQSTGSHFVSSAKVTNCSNHIRVTVRKCSLEKNIGAQFKDRFKNLDYRPGMPKINSSLLEGTLLETSQNIQMYNTHGLRRSDSIKLSRSKLQNSTQDAYQSEAGHSRFHLNSPPQVANRESRFSPPRLLFPFVMKAKKKKKDSSQVQINRPNFCKSRTPLVVTISILVNDVFDCSKVVPVLQSSRLIKKIN